ncbi:IST1 homolog [Centruroides vittatus]|uniref:IST1 homolog n=1 Tax=Centruroides vittatus TaxID=120091 RepID=UPI00350F4BC9
MFAPRPNYSKLKTNLRLCINRLKLLEKKKSELSLKARREIADYISNGKCERAKIKVEHIIREDYLVEAMEIIEMFCDLLLARFGLIEQMKLMDEGLSEPISSIIWATPRLQTDLAEIKVISDQLTIKYGKQYTQCVLMNTVDTVNQKLIQKLSVAAPSKLLVEKYMIEIAKSNNIPYDPDLDVMREETAPAVDYLIDIDSDFKKFPPPAGGNFGAGGFICPPVPTERPFDYPKMQQNMDNSSGPPPYSSMLPEGHKRTFEAAPPPDMPYPYIPPSNTDKEKSQVDNPNWDQYQGLPSVPGAPSAPSQAESVDFDALTKRFEELKKRPL